MIVAGCFLLLFALDDSPAAQGTATVKAAVASKSEINLSPQDQADAGLASVRRIYVDLLTGGESALRIRDLLISAIQGTKLFVLTEQEDRADAVLKGAGHDQVFEDTFQSTEGINAHTQVSLGGGATSNQRYSNRTYANVGIGENESHKIEERKHEAIATVRLVNKDGDVVWSATEESLGAKFAGASVDVVTKITKRLAADYEKARAGAPGSGTGLPDRKPVK